MPPHSEVGDVSQHRLFLPAFKYSGQDQGESDLDPISSKQHSPTAALVLVDSNTSYHSTCSWNSRSSSRSLSPSISRSNICPRISPSFPGSLRRWRSSTPSHSGHSSTLVLVYSLRKKLQKRFRESMTAWLAGPGWLEADRDAECFISRHHELLYGNTEQNGHLQGEPVRHRRRREAWKVGICYNPFRPVDLGLSFVEKRLSHWGVYIRRVNSKNEHYKVYSLDFDDLTSTNLVLQAIWATDEDGWQRNVFESEIRKISWTERTLYFCLEEFVLNAQWELNVWLQCYVDDKCRKISQGKSSWDREMFKNLFSRYGTLENTGFVYDLFERNCQHYAGDLYDNLLCREWDDRDRLDQKWDPDAFWDNISCPRNRKPRDKRWRWIKKGIEWSAGLALAVAPYVLMDGLKS